MFKNFVCAATGFLTEEALMYILTVLGVRESGKNRKKTNDGRGARNDGRQCVNAI